MFDKNLKKYSENPHDSTCSVIVQLIVDKIPKEVYSKIVHTTSSIAKVKVLEDYLKIIGESLKNVKTQIVPNTGGMIVVFEDFSTLNALENREDVIVVANDAVSVENFKIP